MPSSRSSVPPAELEPSQPRAGSFRSALDAIGSVVVVLSPDNRILQWNSEAARLYGCRRRDVLGKDYVELFIPEAHQATIAANIRRVLRTRQNEAFEKPIRTIDGIEKTLLWSVRPLLDDRDEPIGVIACGQDITDRKQTEERLLESRQRLRDLSDHLRTVREEERTSLARQIHDELGQALTALSMDLSWLEDQIQSKRGRTRSDMLLAKITQMQTISAATIDLVRGISTSLRPAMLDDLGLAATLEWEARRFQDRYGIRCEWDLEPGVFDTETGPKTVVYRIFLEALVNVVRHARASRVAIRLHQARGVVTLEVRDNGIGVRPEELNHPRSLGVLGMRERAHQFAGEIEIEGTPGKGTVVRLQLPVRASEHP